MDPQHIASMNRLIQELLINSKYTIEEFFVEHNTLRDQNKPHWEFRQFLQAFVTRAIEKFDAGGVQDLTNFYGYGSYGEPIQPPDNDRNDDYDSYQYTSY